MTERDVKAVLQQSRDSEIEALIQLLKPSEERTILHLRYYERLGVEKCAERMYVSKSTAYRILKNAHKMLCEVMEAEG